MPMNITYDKNSIVNSFDYFPTDFSTVLTMYRSDEYIESIIIFNVLRNIALNGTVLDCITIGLDSATLNVFVNVSGNIIIIYTRENVAI